MKTYRVALHGHAATWVEVEAADAQEANRKAIAAAPKNSHVKSWTPVMTCDMTRESK